MIQYAPMYMCIRVETGSGHLGHILSMSSGSDSVYKISWSDGFCIGLYALIMVSHPNLSNALNMLNSDDASVSPQDILRD